MIHTTKEKSEDKSKLIFEKYPFLRNLWMLLNSY